MGTPRDGPRGPGDVFGVNAMMKQLFRGASAIAFVVMSAAPATALADHTRGVEAFRSGQIDKARDAWARYARAGDVRSMKLLGDLFSLETLEEVDGLPIPRDADGIDVDLSEALAWYTLAAYYTPEVEIGPDDRSAQIIAEERLAELRETMTEKEVSDAEKRVHYLLASSGSGYHMLVLGKLYQRGEGLPKDDEEALLYYKLAADRDVASAGAYAEALDSRIGLSSKKREAFEEKYRNWQPPLPEDYSAQTPYLERLARENEEAAQRKLREALERTNRIPTLLIQEALNALGYRAGTEDGEYGPSTRAAVRRWEFDKVKNNRSMSSAEKDAAVDGILSAKEKVELIKDAAKRDHPKSEYTLGLLYAEGVGVEADGKKAETELKKAADELAIANYALGMLYINGTTGVNPIEPDSAEARYYLSQAYARGYTPALTPLRQIEFEKTR